MDTEKIWADVLENLKVNLSPASFATWFPQTFLARIKEVDPQRQILEIGCPNAFIRDNIETRYYALIKDAVDQLTQKKNDLVFLVKEKQGKTIEKSIPKEPLFQKEDENIEVQGAISRVGLRPDFNFDTFAVSSSNQMAHAAALAVVQAPGKAYNPLFLYGGVGVGKTHLMQAIGNAILHRTPKTKIIFCMGEEFTNGIIDAIRQKTTREFKQKYRSAKVLLIDDIQFIAGKTTVQEEFFHTFNAVWRAGGQIVLTSDRRPDEINNLEDRLRSRFEGGLTIDIQAPDFELRTAILLIKAQQHDFQIPMDVAQLIASNINSTRRLEGFLVRLISEIKTKQEKITPDLVSALLGKTQETSTPKKIIKPKEVLRSVVSHYNLKISDLVGASRLKNIAVPRQVAMYLLRNELKLPLMDIGRLLGNRDHTTIMHGVEKITKLLPDSEDLRVDIAGIKQQVYG